VVFDDELTPAQQANLEKILGRSAIDRTAVILDIFAQNAHSQEGKAQVQLALYRYRLPRLRGKGLSLSQQAGGIGARRGPGETQLEIDRRRIQRQIHKLEADLRQIDRHRAVQRKGRTRARVPHVVIVGYTNAGKSTLLNRLTDAGVLVEDRLFATLDATTRRLELPGGEGVLVTDTVGFVRKLPHQLVEAFRSTLEVVLEADLLVHVVDGAGPDPDGCIAAVHEVIGEIGGGAVEELVVFNKLDRSPGVQRLAEEHPGSVAISARSGEGVQELLLRIGDRLRARIPKVVLEVPWDRGDVVAALHRHGEVLKEEPGDLGMRVTARLPEEEASRWAEFLR
jgi:GTP-binding protein HflX